MTLAFSTQLNDKPTFFVEKILIALNRLKIIPLYTAVDCYSSYLKQKKDATVSPQNEIGINPKSHTIRQDLKNRWKAGMDIHFVINNRTKNRYQFAPIIKCVSTQKISITYWYNKKTKLFDLPMIIIDNKVQTENKIETLAVNDGFDNSVEFFKYFNKNFEGVLIHWTNYKY